MVDFGQRLGEPVDGAGIPPFRPLDATLPLGMAPAFGPVGRIVAPFRVGLPVERIGVQSECVAGHLIGMEDRCTDRAVATLAQPVRPGGDSPPATFGEAPEEFPGRRSGSPGPTS